MLFILLFTFFGLIAAALAKEAYARPKAELKRDMREHRVGKVGNPYNEL